MGLDGSRGRGRRCFLGLLLGFAIAFGTAPARAQELRIGLALETSALDPHYRLVAPNEAVARSFFDSLVLQDETQKLTPGLALAWRPVGDKAWEFTLRPGVRFSDGAPFTAEDVAFSLKRAPEVPGAPGGYGIYVKAITGITIVDPLTIRLETAGPYPLMPADLSVVPIVSHRIGAEARTADFNSGKALIGTGPFRLVEWRPGERLVMARNDDYWGPRPAWARVVLKPIPNDSARVAALLAGDVDLIEGVLPSLLPELEHHDGIGLARTVTDRVIYLGLDSFAERSPFITDADGAPLDRNPLRDARVRAAISRAIDRRVIAERLMPGMALPAGQLLPDGFSGVSPRLAAEPYAPEAARRLLAEAGYGKGFGLTLHAAGGRIVNAEKVALALGEMLSRVGLRARVEMLPEAVLRTRASRFELSLFMTGWGSETAEASSPLRALVAGIDPARGWGFANRGRYANAELDRLLGEALATIDDGARAALLAQASEVAMADHAVIPLYYEVASWAFRRGLAYHPRTDEFTLPIDALPVP